MRGLQASCAALGLAGALLTLAAGPARADGDDWHHGWHGRYDQHWDHGRGRPVYVGPPPAYYARPPAYYAPPPVYYGPPPAYYAPPPVYYGLPSVSLNFGIR